MAGKEKRWFVWEKIRRIHPMQVAEFFTYLGDLPEPATKVHVGAKFENGNIELISPESEYRDCGEKVAARAISNPDWIRADLDRMEQLTKQYRATAEKVVQIDFSGKSDKQLLEIFKELHSAYLDSHCSCSFVHMAEFLDEALSKNIRKALAKKIAAKKIRVSEEKAFAVLSQPKGESVLIKERQALSDLIEKILPDKELSALFGQKTIPEIEQLLPKSFPEFNTLLVQHWKKFNWMFFMYEGPALPKSYFIKELKENKAHLDAIRKEPELVERILALQQKLLKRLCDSEAEKIIFSLPRRIIETKTLRKDAMYFGAFVFEKLFAEIAKRLGTSIDCIRYMQRQELIDALSGKPAEFEIFKRRFEYSIFLSFSGNTHWLLGEEARKWYKENIKEEFVSAIKELHGTPAFHGSAKGLVRIISHPNEIFKMNNGDILVSHMTNPNLLPAMTKAAAIVTDIGGLTCHAAIVAREFRIPCIVGTKVATQVLQDNDLVEVDAEKGIVKKIG